MALLGAWNYVFADGIGVPYVASGVRVMSDLDQIKTILNNLDELNIATASKVLCTDRAKTVSAIITFSANPVFNAGGIADAALTANIPKKNAANTMSGDNTFSGLNTFSQAIQSFKPPTLVAHPSVVGDDGKVYIYSGGLYIYKHGTGPVSLDYNGAYTGGALKSYCGELIIDNNTPGYIMVKTDASITSAILKLFATNFPSWVYTELPAHTHAVGSLALTSGLVTGLEHTHNVVMGSHTHAGSFGTSTHIHTEIQHRHSINFGTFATASGGSHSHTFSGSAGNTGDGDAASGVVNHHHGFTPAGTVSTDSGHTHNVTVDGYTAYETPAIGTASASASVSSADLGTIVSAVASFSGTPIVGTGITGSTASKGMTGGGTINETLLKAQLDTNIQVNISATRAVWGATYDKGSAGWSSLANIYGNTGSDAIDISSYLSPATYYFIKISEPTANMGGKISYLIEIA
jgi:hypothetical protein